MAGCQRGQSLSMLATHGYNNIITCIWSIWNNTEEKTITKLVPWGTDGRLPLSDLDLDLGSGHTAYRRVSLIDLYLHIKLH